MAIHGDTLACTASLADGSPLPAWLGFDAATRTFSGTPGNGDVGTVSIRVTATDTAGAVAAQTFTLSVANVNDAPVVANAIPDQSAAEGQAFSYQLAANAFADVDTGDTLGFSATLADGSALPAWLSFDAATRSFTGTPGDGTAGSYSVRITATDGSGASVSDDFVLSVADTIATARNGTSNADTLEGAGARALWPSPPTPGPDATGGPLMRVEFESPSNSVTTILVGLSPDGRYVSHTHATSGVAGRQLMIQDLGTGQAAPVPDSRGGWGMAWSPRSDGLVFSNIDGELRHFKLGERSSRPVVSLAKGSAGLRGFTWLADDTLVFVTRADGVQRVPLGGGPIVPVVNDPTHLFGFPSTIGHSTTHVLAFSSQQNRKKNDRGADQHLREHARPEPNDQQRRDSHQGDGLAGDQVGREQAFKRP